MTVIEIDARVSRNSVFQNIIIARRGVGEPLELPLFKRLHRGEVIILDGNSPLIVPLLDYAAFSLFSS